MPRFGRLANLFILGSQHVQEAARRLPTSHVCQPGRTACALFTMPQSLTTYAMSICIVATITRAARTILRIESDSVIVPLAASLAVGCAIVIVVATDTRARPRGALEWASAVLVAGVNSLVLFSATIGIDKF
jgi:hypothetical protein